MHFPLATFGLASCPWPIAVSACRPATCRATNYSNVYDETSNIDFDVLVLAAGQTPGHRLTIAPKNAGSLGGQVHSARDPVRCACHDGDARTALAT